MPAYTPCTSDRENSGARAGRKRQTMSPATNATTKATSTSLPRRVSLPASPKPTVRTSGSDCGDAVVTARS